jgi:hypothetical protein
MGRMVGMYILGFAYVWAAVALVSAAVAGFKHFSDNWDRALKRELLGNAREARAGTEPRRS